MCMFVGMNDTVWIYRSGNNLSELAFYFVGPVDPTQVVRRNNR